MLFKLFLTFLLLVCCCSLFSATLEGIVVDQSGLPLLGVTVSTDEPGVGTQTDDNGEFKLLLSEGVKRITFSSIGFKPVQYHVDKIPETVVLEAAVYKTGQILVSAERAEKGVTPAAFSNMSSSEIERDYSVGEFPLLLKNSPNLHTFVDAGSSLGFGSVKIRGFDDRRVVTYINGVPLNDPEDQLTYFVDLPDFASNIADIQIQRGVGNSLYGDASFGGTINVVTNSFNSQRQTSVSFGYGEYLASGKSIGGIYKQNFEFSSGLVNGKWVYGGRFSKQKSDGYRHDSWYRGWSYYFTVGRIDPKMTTEIIIYGGPLKYHAAWYGAFRGDLAVDRRINVGIPGYDELTYENASDNFNQPHYHLHNTYKISDKATLKNSFYYIRGRGFYEQYKPYQTFSDYNIDASLTSGVLSGDLVRQLWVEKNQYGWNPRLDIEHGQGRHTLGGSFYYFNSDHYGKVVWAQGITGLLNPKHEYHNYFGKKYVGSLFATEYYHLNDRLSAQITAQLRYQHYDFDQKKIGPYKGYQYTLDNLFFSPRIGFSYKINERVNIFTNFAVASRTPTDKAIYDGDDPAPWEFPKLEIIDSSSVNNETVYKFGDPTVRSERVYDLELGMNYNCGKVAFDLNLYWMKYTDMIVAEGGVTDGITGSLNINAAVHSGLEFSGTYRLDENLSLTGNFAYNRNRITDFVQIFTYDFDTVDAGSNPIQVSETIAVDLKDKKISRYPEVLGNLIVNYQTDRIELTYYGNYIGRQYSELFNIEELSIAPVFVSSLGGKINLGNFMEIGVVSLSAKVDNLFSKKYEAAVAYAENYAYRLPNGSAVVDGWSTYYVASELSFFAQLKLEMF